MKSRYHELTNLTVKNPCPANWEDMYGDERQKFCSLCDLHVTNISAMTKRDAARFLDSKSGQRVCVHYQPDQKGLPVYRKSGWLVALATLALSIFGCRASAPEPESAIGKIASEPDSAQTRQPVRGQWRGISDNIDGEITIPEKKPSKLGKTNKAPEESFRERFGNEKTSKREQ